MRHVRKEYIYDIKLKDRFWFLRSSKTITIRYKQASLSEVMEFVDYMKSDGASILERAKEFIILKSSDNPKKRCSEEQASYALITLGVEKIYETYFHGAFKDGEKSIDTKRSPESSSIISLCSHMHIDPDTLIRNYTPEMISYYTEGIVRNINESSDKGKQKNRAKEIEMKSKLSKGGMSDLDKAFAKLDARGSQ